MDKFIEKLRKLTGTVHLKHEDKAAIKSRIIQAMEHPQPVIHTASAHIFRRFFVPALSFVAVILIAGGGTSIAAEYALPGDPLYPIKVRFNEPLVGLLNAAPPLKAAWQVRVVERRLEEADKLALQGKLDQNTKAELAINFAESAGKAQQAITGLTSQGDAQEAVDVSARLEASLKGHAAILAKFDTEQNKASGSLESKIAAALNQAVAARHNAESKVAAVSTDAETDTAAQGKIGVATNIIASVKNYLDAQRSVLGIDALNNANNRLQIAEDLLSTAKTKQASSDFSEAFKLAGKAIRRAQETQVLASAQVDANQSAAVSAAAPAAEISSTTASTTTSGISAAATLNFLAGGDISTSSDDNSNNIATSTVPTATSTNTGQSATSTATSTPVKDGKDGAVH